jgi:hypothetical protein
VKRFSAVRAYVTLSIAAAFVAIALVMPAIASAQSAPPPPQTCADATSTASADADASLDEQAPIENFGADPTLRVMSAAIRENARAVVRFPVPQAPPGCVVQSATLRLYSDSPPERPSTLQALRLTSAWGESNISWENQPATAGPVAETWGGFGYVQWDVTAHVQAMYADGGNHGFLIRHAVENHPFGAEAGFFSKEQLEFPPQLVVCFAGCASGGGGPPAPPPPPLVISPPAPPPLQLPTAAAPPGVQAPAAPATEGGTPSATPRSPTTQPLGPSVAQVVAALKGDLRTAAASLRRLGIAALVRRQGANVKSVHALIPGTIRISTVIGGRRVVVLGGTRSFARAGNATLRLKLTKRGRQVLKRKPSAKFTLRGSFADRSAVIRAAHTVTVKRSGGR